MGHGFGGHAAHHYHSVGSHHFGRNFCNCLCCFLCLGPILFLTGFGLLISSLTDFRTGHIDNYNAAVTAWTTSDGINPSNYQILSAVMNVSMVFSYFPLTSTLLANSLSESYISDNDQRISSYSDYIRFMSPAVIDLSSRCSQYAPWYGCDLTAYASFELFVGGKSVNYISVPAFTRSRKPVSQESQCDAGDYWDSFSSNCDTYSVISDICVKISQEALGGWSVDNSFGGPGCGTYSWNAASYTRLRIESSFDFPTRQPVLLTVRSVKDPRVAFYGEMGPGSTNFGMTQGAKARTGIVLLIIGGIILFFLCGAAFKLMRLDKHHRHYEEVRAPVMIVTPTQPVVYYQQPPVVYATPAYPPQYQHPGQYQQPGYYQQSPVAQVPVAYVHQ